MIKIYFAARYSRHPEMQRYRAKLHAYGSILVTSRWIDAHDGTLPISLGADDLKDPTRGREFAEADIEDIDEAHVFIAFTESDGRYNKGGRHVEFGYAYCQGKQLIVIGPRENVFYCLDGVEQHDTWEDFVKEGSIWRQFIKRS